MRYFAYGSNMSRKRFTARIPSVKAIGVARLECHKLCFHKKGRDGSAKCDIVLTSNHEDVVYGVIFEIADSVKQKLDRYEGNGRGYAEKQVHVTTEDGRILQAMTYYALRIDTTLKPYHWYKEHVLIGARENELPAEYIKMIEAVDSCRDSNLSRYRKEMAVYDQVP